MLVGFFGFSSVFIVIRYDDIFSIFGVGFNCACIQACMAMGLFGGVWLENELKSAGVVTLHVGTVIPFHGIEY